MEIKEFTKALDELLTESRTSKENAKEQHDALAKVVKSASDLKKNLERLDNVLTAQGRRE